MKFRLNQLSVAENLFSTNTSGEMTISNAIDINYADLVALKQAGNLMPHRSYRIQDYQTVHFVHAVKPGNVPFGAGDTTLQDEELNTNVASIPVEVLIVTANSTNELRCTAYSETYPTDIIHYELEPSTNQLDTPSTGHFGVITYRRDENGNESYFDFRNTIFPRWEKIPGSGSYNHWIEGGFGGGVVYVRAFDNTKCTNVKIAPFVGLNFSPFFSPFLVFVINIKKLLHSCISDVNYITCNSWTNFNSCSIYHIIFISGRSGIVNHSLSISKDIDYKTRIMIRSNSRTTFS